MNQLAFQLNSLLDRNEKLNLEETKKHVNEQTVLEWLVEKFPNEEYDVNFSYFLHEIRKDKITEELWNRQSVLYDNLINNNGICYLIALSTLE